MSGKLGEAAGIVVGDFADAEPKKRKDFAIVRRDI